MHNEVLHTAVNTVKSNNDHVDNDFKNHLLISGRISEYNDVKHTEIYNLTTMLEGELS